MMGCYRHKVDRNVPKKVGIVGCAFFFNRGWVMVFNNSSVILVEETGENHRHVASH